MIWISSAAIVIPPLIGLAGTAIGMFGAMDKMGLEGGSDPDVLAENISLALITTAGGLFVSLLALPVFIAAIMRFVRVKREIRTLTRTEYSRDGKPDPVSS